jgi:DNA sulfur modification protein DndD
MPWKHISIARLEMTNFKRFYGRHQIELLSQPELGKPLVLIGGDNGRGKTSIHEAINYALYEDDDLPGINTRPNYLRAVSDRLNRRALDEGKNDYYVAVEILANANGADRRIRIERHWEVNIAQRSVTNVNLRIFENGRPIDFIEDSPGAYQDFLRSLLPPRIAPFFFFDGERIQEFADDDTHERKMVDAIEDILHITVYKALRDDLKKYVIDHIEKHDVQKQSTDDFFGLQGDKERIETELEENRDRLADIEREMDSLSREQKQVEDELRRIASPHASKRDELIAERMRLNRELEEAKNDLQARFEPLPLLLAGALRADLRKALEKEQGGIATPERIERLQRQVLEIRRRVLEEPSPEPPANLALSKAQSQFYVQLFDEVSSEVLGLARKTQPYLHDIGEAGRRKILERLDVVEQQGSLLQEALNRRERLSNELRDVEIKLQSTSDDPHVEELINRNKAISEKIGALREEKLRIEGEIQRLEADLATRARQVEDRQEQRKATGTAKQTIKLAQNARRVLDEFIKRLAPEKLAILRQHMDEMYKRLRKPEDPVKQIEIDAETWQVILKDQKDRPLEKRVFSQGMKEMYALSLLWALSKASGRELPIVIDTPVGRLDTTNRRTLFEKYLPYAGHQVIVLSTDTEVDVEWAKRLAPHVARQYRLDYDSSADSTVIRQGYFF